MYVAGDEIHRIARQIRGALPVDDVAEGILSLTNELPDRDEQRVEDALIILNLIGGGRTQDLGGGVDSIRERVYDQAPRGASAPALRSAPASLHATRPCSRPPHRTPRLPRAALRLPRFRTGCLPRSLQLNSNDWLRVWSQ